MDVNPILEQEQSAFLDTNLGKDGYFPVNVDIEIASDIIQHRDQPLEDLEFVMCNDEPGVFHRLNQE